jgi:hypothetical protein
VAINLWKTGGKPTVYNPLIGTVNLPNLGIGEYVLNFKAKSPTSSKIRFGGLNSDLRVNGASPLTLTLTPNLTSYSLSVTNASMQYIAIVDNDSSANIYIQDIELVQKPLPKLTINGVDGFTSGKWTIDNKFTVIDEETLYFDGSTLSVSAYATFDFDTVVGQSYVLSFANPTPNSSTIWDVRTLPVDGSYGSTSTGQTSFSFTATTNRTRIRARVNVGAVAYYYKRPMLNLGTSPVPYSRKTGDRMMLPTAKKNMVNFFDSVNVGQATGITNTIINSNSLRAVYNSTSIAYRATYFVANVRPNTIYNLSCVYDNTVNTGFDVKTLANVYVGGGTLSGNKMTCQFDSGSNTQVKLNFYCVYDTASTTGSLTISDVQLEEGSATSFEPFKVQINKRPNHVIAKERSGMAFNGVTDYLQLPSMTMDSIEIDCLIDSVQPNNDPVLVDARTGLVNGYATALLGIGSGWNTFKINGVDTAKSWSNIPKGTRTKVYLQATGSFTDDVGIFGGSGSRYGKGTLYKVTCYLNDQVVAQYDFENPSNVVGNTVLPKINNIIPSFEDPRWNIHANAQVLGKDLLRLNATGLNQFSYCSIDVIPNTNYLINANTNGRFALFDDNGIVNISTWKAVPTIFNVGNQTKARFYFWNHNGVGLYDFIKPQLYQVDGTQGTINGTPVQLNKQTKRTLYAKR